MARRTKSNPLDRRVAIGLGIGAGLATIGTIVYLVTRDESATRGPSLGTGSSRPPRMTLSPRPSSTFWTDAQRETAIACAAKRWAALGSPAPGGSAWEANVVTIANACAGEMYPTRTWPSTVAQSNILLATYPATPEQTFWGQMLGAVQIGGGYTPIT